MREKTKEKKDIYTSGQAVYPMHQALLSLILPYYMGTVFLDFNAFYHRFAQTFVLFFVNFC